MVVNSVRKGIDMSLRVIRNNICLLLRGHLQEIHARYGLSNFHTQSFPLYAGHSKWANIKHIKALKDGQKAAIFIKFSRQIRLSIQEGGSADPKLNSLLKSVIEQASRNNMPMATIQNSIKKSQQSKAILKKHQVQLRYKQKVFVTVILYTDNFSALKMEMAPILKKAGAAFIDVSHLFEDYGLIETTIDVNSKADVQLDQRVTEDAIECGAEEVEILNPATGEVNFICNVVEMPSVRKSLENKGYVILNTEHVFQSKQFVELTPEEHKAYNIFLEKMRALPGIDDIYDNVGEAGIME